jgi:hypothetical protein
MAEAQLPALARVKIFHIATFKIKILQLGLPPTFPESLDQGFVDIEMLFNRSLPVGRDKQ